MSYFSALVIIDAEDAEDNTGQALQTMEEMLEPYREARFNPISKWDYWVFSSCGSKLICKDGAIERNLTKHSETPNQVDICRFDMLDLEIMRQADIDERRSIWKRVQKIFAKAGDQTFSEQELDRLRVQLLRLNDAIHKRYVQEKLQENYYLWRENFLTSSEAHHLALLEQLHGSQSYENIQDWINDVCGFNVFAFVDSIDYWREKNRMGWFGISTDEVNPKDWEIILKERIQRIQPNDWVAIVDCHI